MLVKIAMSLKGDRVKRIILAALLFLIFTSFVSLSAQWARTYEGSENDEAYSIQQTNDGGIFLQAPLHHLVL